MNIALTLLTCKFLTSDMLLKIRCPRGLRSCSQHSGVSAQRSPCHLMGFLSLRASISAVVYMQIEPAFSALTKAARYWFYVMLLNKLLVIIFLLDGHCLWTPLQINGLYIDCPFSKVHTKWRTLAWTSLSIEGIKLIVAKYFGLV